MNKIFSWKGIGTYCVYMLGVFVVVSTQQITFQHRWPDVIRKISAFVHPQKPYNTKLTPEILSEFYKGGLTFFVRHATRDKITSMPAFDRLVFAPSIEKNLAYKKATCLNDQGKAEAWMLGKAFDYLQIPVGKVYASPTCRTRETAKIAFSQIDLVEPVLLYPFSEVGSNVVSQNEENARQKGLKALLYAIPKSGNTVIVSHVAALTATEWAKIPLTEAGIIAFRHIDDRHIEVAFESSLPELVVQAISPKD